MQYAQGIIYVRFSLYKVIEEKNQFSVEIKINLIEFWVLHIKKKLS